MKARVYEKLQSFRFPYRFLYSLLPFRIVADLLLIRTKRCGYVRSDRQEGEEVRPAVVLVDQEDAHEEALRQVEREGSCSSRGIR